MQGGRINSLFPPYSLHSQWAAVIVFLLTCGVLGASRLPPAPLPLVATRALGAWKLLAAVWAVLLAWLLLCDPRARPPREEEFGEVKDAQRVVHCRHGCVFTAAPRTKHCRQCDKCVEGFDHHCLWLNTCVGSYNYRPWVLFVAVLFAWAVLGSGISWGALLRALRVQSRSLAVGHRPAALVTALGTAVTAVWLLALLALHAYLTFKGLTTREWIKGEGGAAAEHCPVVRSAPEGADEERPSDAAVQPGAELGAEPWIRSNLRARSQSLPERVFLPQEDVHRAASFSELRGHTSWRRFILLSAVDTLDCSPHMRAPGCESNSKDRFRHVADP